MFTLTLTDFAMPEILGGGSTDFFANAIYDAFFQLSDAGLGSALGMILVVVGSLAVTLALLAFGGGALGVRGPSEHDGRAARGPVDREIGAGASGKGGAGEGAS